MTGIQDLVDGTQTPARRSREGQERKGARPAQNTRTGTTLGDRDRELPEQ
jgi:hypothetical protein